MEFSVGNRTVKCLDDKWAAAAGFEGLLQLAEGFASLIPVFIL